MISTILPQLSVQLADHALGSLILLLLVIPVSYIVCNECVRYSRRIKGFSGPTNWPLVGNIPDIKYNAAEKYREWSKQYGAVYQIQLGNEPVIVVNSAEAAKKIFGGNSQALSSRPVFWTFHKVLSNTAGTTIGTSPFNESLKRRRKGAASALNKPSIATYIGHLDLETKEFVKDGFESGKAGTVGVNPMPMIERLSLSLALTLNWGTRMGSRHDPMFHEICDVEAAISKFRSTTGNLQDYIPILRLNPFSFGTRSAKEYRRRRDLYLTKLNRDLDDRMEKGIHKPCIQANIIQNKEAALNKEELTSISLTMLSGGLDTITTLVQWSVALLAQRLDIQEKAIKEIRKFYSENEPLADAYDDQKCGYIVALVRECLRYYTVLRLALPRATVKDVMYEGKLIPAGSTIYLNAWACNMDPEVWSDPDEFRPERWLEQPDAPLHTYGLGYRMCAGSLLANRELYLVFLRMLNSFELVQDSDVDVHPVRGSSDPTSLVTMCQPYKIIFKPRNERILREALEAADARLAEGEKEKTMLAGDEELGKKDDDHRFKPARKTGWSLFNPTFRWRRRRMLLAVAGLFLLYYLFHDTTDDNDESTDGRYPSPLGRPITSTYEKPSAPEDEPTGPPPGMQRPRRGDAVPHAYDGQIRFFHLASTLRSSASATGGYDRKNRNILFAMSSLKSASTVLTMACDMSKWNRNHVHAVFMGRDDISLEALLEINGIDKVNCPAVWHDARPDYTEYSTDTRAESTVVGAMSHINSFLHPQAVIMDDSLLEDAFFVRGMRSKTRALGMTLIEVPKDRLEDFMWVTRLDAGSLRHWHDPIVDILIQVPPDSSSVLRLLRSIKDANYSGLRPPRIIIELPAELDVSVKEHIEQFEWPPNNESPMASSGVTIRRRISNHRHNQEEAAIHFLELFYPTSTSNSHVLLLSAQAQLAPQYFHFVKYALLEYKYSEFGAHDSGGLMGVSLELPPTLLDNKVTLKPPTVSDMHTDRYKKLFPSTKSAPFMWQAPNSHAALFLGDKWAELHSFLSNRVIKHQDSVKRVSRAKLVSETLPAWTEYMLEFMRARGYSLLYPATDFNVLVTIHNELYHAPEEFTGPLATSDKAPAAPRKDDEPFLRAQEAPAAPRNAEPRVMADSVPLHQALPFGGDLPEIPHLPQLLYDGQQIDVANVSGIAKAYADTFRQEVGGCEIPKGMHRKVVAGEAGDLFCFGDEGRGEWEEDVTREVEMFDAPIDDELQKLMVDDRRREMKGGLRGKKTAGTAATDDTVDDVTRICNMLARAAAGRKVRRDVLTLPRLCPALSRPMAAARTTHTGSDKQLHTRRASLSSRRRGDTRSLATTAELHPPPPSSLSFNPFAQSFGRKIPPPDLSQLPPWDGSSPLVVHDSLVAKPSIKSAPGVGTDPLEMHQNLYACLRVGRIDRAAVIIARLVPLYNAGAPEVVDAHNVYLLALLELGQTDAKGAAMTKLTDWYDSMMLRKGVQPNAQTFVTLIRAAMHFLHDDAQEAAVRGYIAAARAQGEHIVDSINASPDFSDEEWDVLIRLQPESFDEPPPVQDVQDLHVSTPAGRKSLIDYGLVSHPAQDIKPVPQKGMGLDSLKEALAVFDQGDRVPYPHDMNATQEEKDQAYAYARQLQMEQDGIEAAVKRWKLEDEKMQDIGIHGVLNQKPIQALMYGWYTTLVPLFKKQIEHVKKVLSEPAESTSRDDAHTYGVWLERCTPERLAAITVARTTQAAVRGKGEDSSALKISALSIAVGTDIEDFLNAEAQTRREAFLKKQRKQTRLHLINTLSKTAQDPSPERPAQQPPALSHTPVEYEKVDIPLPARTKLGAMCIEQLLQSATIVMTAIDPRTGKQISRSMAAFHHQVGFHGGKKLGFIVPHHELLTKMRTDSVHSIQTVRLPMVVEPKPWTSFEDGGYYTVPQKVVRQKGGDPAQRAYAQLAIENGDMSKVMAGLDVLGRVPWQINARVFDVMARAWNDGESIGSLVGEDVVNRHKRPPEPPADASYQERAKWNKDVQEHENTIGGLHSQRCFQNFQLETARAYVNEKKIYFPHSVDFRGRAYPIPPILNHIGSDISRGLLKFAHGKELGTIGLQWLKVHLANLYGFDKASLREREQFSMDNLDDIYDSANNPLDGRRWWTKAEDPWQCLACCIELKNALDSPDPTRFLSQLPVHQDGTCNGLQHYAALGGDHAGARQVNLEPSDRPQDIYTGVAELVKEMVTKDAAKGSPIAKYIDGHITRKVVKRTVMTNVYGVTFMGAKQQVQDELKSLFPNFQPTDKIFEALGKIFNGAQEIQYWLGECGDRITTSITAEQIKRIRDRFEGADPTHSIYDSKFTAPKTITKSQISKLNKNIEKFKTAIIWTTPLKMPIVQPYRKDGVQKIKTKIQDITVTKKSAQDEVDKRKQLQAFPPNFIHSLDATHMTLSALKASEMGLDFAAVHDSFWTHASDIPNLNVILRDAFVRMHTEDIIDRLAAEFSARYAGAMYRANIVSTSPVGQKINKWRLDRRRNQGMTFKSSGMGKGEASYEEVALESQRQQLLNSQDPAQRQEGEKMETPTSIWLANPDPKSIASFRLQLLGESKDKESANRQTEVRDKVLGSEAEAVGTSESTMDLVEDGAEDLAKVPQNGCLPIKKLSSRLLAEKGTIQVWIPLSFPPVPKKGGWDVSRLRESKYFFS
ncbi:DNA-directed RNA polymerase mitochondrial precursor [Stemphylium lycopersici]|nr:DNA-directed RNA polymerase mitochondrial precursor [Stemphylium lycopersici]